MAKNANSNKEGDSLYYFVRFIKKTLRYLLKPLSFVPAIAMMIIIYNFSGQNGTDSAGLSLIVSKYVVLAYNKICMKGLDNHSLNELIIMIHPYVRKGAHVTEYLLLAMSVSLPMYVYRFRGFFMTLLGGAFCVCFAVADEYHQSFVAGRVSDPKDVLIDSIGIVIGLIVMRIVCAIGRKTIFHWFVLDE